MYNLNASLTVLALLNNFRAVANYRTFFFFFFLSLKDSSCASILTSIELSPHSEWITPLKQETCRTRLSHASQCLIRPSTVKVHHAHWNVTSTGKRTVACHTFHSPSTCPVSIAREGFHSPSSGNEPNSHTCDRFTIWGHNTHNLETKNSVNRESTTVLTEV